jgi:hypothetical protein
MCAVRRLLLAAFVAGALGPLAVAAAPQGSPVVVTRDSLALRCSPRDVAEVLLRFEAALGAGDRKGLDRLFAPDGGAPPSFQWFSIDETVIRSRDSLVPYLLQLHARGEGFRFVGIDVGNSWVPHSVGFGVALLRVGGASEQLHGKGEIDCARRRIYVWSVGKGAAVSPCPAPPQANALRTVVACSRTGRKPLAQEVSRDFALETTPLRLPGRCGPAMVKTRVAGALRAFNLAGAKAFARTFTRGATMQPYTGSQPPPNLRGRSQIAAFAIRRAARSDGWTAAKLFPPTGTVGLPTEAIYGMTLRVSSPHGGGENGAKLVIDCRSGLISHWVGPGLAAPR